MATGLHRFAASESLAVQNVPVGFLALAVIAEPELVLRLRNGIGEQLQKAQLRPFLGCLGVREGRPWNKALPELLTRGQHGHVFTGSSFRLGSLVVLINFVLFVPRQTGAQVFNRAIHWRALAATLK